ncbi:hypothetical protein ACIQF6_14885 [Kitasatospora sp. NPDC092948]|uniref:hypothetical protein n=1 Tax=Kitasatospora sp. NPDC092948 TaxID=3364088 RepID=UPI003802394E
MPPSRAQLAAKHARVIELATAGRSTASIANELHMDRRQVRQIRADANIPSLPAGRIQTLTVEEKWQQRVRELPDGHLEWTGERQHTSGTPVMRHSGQTYTAARIAYRIKHGTDPIGYATPGCGTRHCIAPDHIDDLPRRTRDRAALRTVLGTRPRSKTCQRSGHDQDIHGRIEPNGSAYCAACKRDDKAKYRKTTSPAA